MIGSQSFCFLCTFFREGIIIPTKVLVFVQAVVVHRCLDLWCYQKGEDGADELFHRVGSFPRLLSEKADAHLSTLADIQMVDGRQKEDLWWAVRIVLGDADVHFEFSDRKSVV